MPNHVSLRVSAQVESRFPHADWPPRWLSQKRVHGPDLCVGPPKEATFCVVPAALAVNQLSYRAILPPLIFRLAIDVFRIVGLLTGGAEGDRTPDLRIANAALCQTELLPHAENDTTVSSFRFQVASIAAHYGYRVRASKRNYRTSVQP